MIVLRRTDGQVPMQASRDIWWDVVNEGHLRSLVREYLGYYHEDRTQAPSGSHCPQDQS